MTSVPSQSAEDYLERILELVQETGQARVVDIANSLNVRQASVTNMVKKLCELGYVDHEKYKRGLVLTKKGQQVALEIQRRHETLSSFFSMLELDDETQRRDIEGIEHHLSRGTVRVLEDLVSFFEEHPEVLKKFLGSRSSVR
ncbi:MAG: transcriptional regulator MntR [Limisphaerales bacterium]|nr:transcriptional regulator [Verrucomicrobiales bacterium]RZO54673.1 MAG: transcriptional regulator MntR [Limisphaerales bacterium]